MTYVCSTTRNLVLKKEYAETAEPFLGRIRSRRAGDISAAVQVCGRSLRNRCLALPCPEKITDVSEEGGGSGMKRQELSKVIIGINPRFILETETYSWKNGDGSALGRTERPLPPRCALQFCCICSYPNSPQGYLPSKPMPWTWMRTAWWCCERRPYWESPTIETATVTAVFRWPL